MALLTEGDTIHADVYKHGPPGGGRYHSRPTSTNMALLTEGEPFTPDVYKHGPPDGGRYHSRDVYKHGPPGGGRYHSRPTSTNMALLAEGDTIHIRRLQTWPSRRPIAGLHMPWLVTKTTCVIIDLLRQRETRLIKPTR